MSPGFIRVEADELTYPLHIVLRFELEQVLLYNTVSNYTYVYHVLCTIYYTDAY